jgi:dihydrolipoamide dehydrogenase
MDSLMPGTDKDLLRPFLKVVKDRYDAIMTSTKVTGMRATVPGIEVAFEGDKAPSVGVYDRVLISVGRRANGDKLGAEKAGVQVDERGIVSVDKQMRTNVPHIFAIGDLAGGPMLAHKATHEAKVAAEVAHGDKSFFDARTIPSVAYTDPEIAWVGLTETEAKEQGVEYEKAQFPWAASGRALSIGRSEGFTKLLFDPKTDRVLGGAIVGPSAGDLIAEIGLAIEMGADATDISLTIHPHPTLSETVAFTAEAFEGTLTDLYIPKKRKR